MSSRILQLSRPLCQWQWRWHDEGAGLHKAAWIPQPQHRGTTQESHQAELDCMCERSKSFWDGVAEISGFICYCSKAELILIQVGKYWTRTQEACVINTVSSSITWHTAATAKSLQSCPTLFSPIDGRPPGSSVPGILQARTLEWVAIVFSITWHMYSLKSLPYVKLHNKSHRTYEKK